MLSRTPPGTIERPSSAPALHIRPDRSGTWLIHSEGQMQPLSRHGNETDAERVAVRRAEELGAPAVIVHDRYHRVHTVSRADPAPQPQSNTDAIDREPGADS